MRYNVIEEETKWWEKGEVQDRKSKPLPPGHNFAYDCVRLRLYSTLVSLGCNSASSILEIGCGAGEEATYISKASKNIVGVDICSIPLKIFKASGFQCILGDVKKLPFKSDSFDYVISPGVLHHLVGQGDLTAYLKEFVRVTKSRGYVIASEPNSFYPSGLLMNVLNAMKPGIMGFVPYERSLSPLHIINIFKRAGLMNVKCVSASYVWNRFPLAISKLISKHEDGMRFRKPFNLFGWFVIFYGQKGKYQGAIK